MPRRTTARPRGPWEQVKGAPAYTLQVATRDFTGGTPTRYTDKIVLTPAQAETILRTFEKTQ